MGITHASPGGTFTIPLSLIFWGYVVVYAVHILEESTLGEVFVEKVRGRFWPDYSWRKFFCFNAILMSLNISAVLVYESLGGAWLIFPLSLALERCLNGFWHLGETIVTRRFSSGLLSSIPTWVLTYFVVRYAVLRQEITTAHFACSALIAVTLTVFMMGSLFLFRRRFRMTLQPRSEGRVPGKPYLEAIRQRSGESWGPPSEAASPAPAPGASSTAGAS